MKISTCPIDEDSWSYEVAFDWLGMDLRHAIGWAGWHWVTCVALPEGRQ